MKTFIILICSVLLFSCAPSISTQIVSQRNVLGETSIINVITEKEGFPKNAIILGTVELGDSGFTTNCSYEVMLELAKTEARKVGGNTLKITQHLFPNIFGSSCHRIKAQILDVSQDDYISFQTNRNENNAVSNIETSKNINLPIKKSIFFVLANVGTSFRTAKVEKSGNSSLDTHTENTLKGMSYDLSGYYVKNQQGFGIKYSVFNSKKTDFVSNYGTLPNIISADFTENVNISFIGPSYIISQNSNSKTGEGNMEMALGYMWYNNILYINNRYFGTAKSSTFGIVWGGGYHFRINKNILIGPQIYFAGGVLKEMDYEYFDGTKETKVFDKNSFESLYRIDLNVSAKIRF